MKITDNNTQTNDVSAVQKQPSKKKAFIIAGILASSVAILAFMLITGNDSKETKTDTEPKTEQSSEKKEKKKTTTTKSVDKTLTPIEQAEAVVSQEAKETGNPYEVKTVDAGGDYTFATVVYHKGDESREYDELRIIAPEVKVAEVTDETATAIKTKLTEKLPVIDYGGHQTIVKDGSKVTVEVYPTNDEASPYRAILLYDGKPFGYVTVDQNQKMTAKIATYALREVIDNYAGNDVGGNVDQYRND